MRSLKRYLLGGVAAVAIAGFGGDVGASAVQSVDQEGLVNLNLTGVTVQLPIALAANLCDVTVAVLVEELSDGSSPCTANSNADAVVATQDGGPVEQDGLVNVNVTDVVVQAPIAIAANVCDVTVAILVERLLDVASPCDAAAAAEALSAVEGETYSPEDVTGSLPVEVPGVTLPTESLPSVTVPDVTLPDVTVPDVTTVLESLPVG